MTVNEKLDFICNKKECLKCNSELQFLEDYEIYNEFFYGNYYCNKCQKLYKIKGIIDHYEIKEKDNDWKTVDFSIFDDDTYEHFKIKLLYGTEPQFNNELKKLTFIYLSDDPNKCIRAILENVKIEI